MVLRAFDVFKTVQRIRSTIMPLMSSFIKADVLIRDKIDPVIKNLKETK